MLQIGLHTIDFVPPDLIRLTVIGDISTAESMDILAYVKRHTAFRPYLLILCDVSRAGDVPPSVRKHWVTEATKLPICGSAMLGASFQIRVLVRMFESVARLFNAQGNPRCFAKTEEEALAWIEERRRTLATPRP